MQVKRSPYSLELTTKLARHVGAQRDDGLELEASRSTVASALFPSLEARRVTVGRYELLRRLGSGGMGIVFEAYDPTLRREVALKLLRPGRGAGQGADQVLLEEAQSAARLVHPSVVTVFDAGQHEGRVFVAMELIRGPSMARWFTKRPPWRQAVAALARAARGIEAAHTEGLIHRDFKPANVLLGPDGRVCVVDFGLARQLDGLGRGARVEDDAPADASARHHTATGEIAGTPAYMAPEQYLGSVQDERTDQFAFCVTLYEALWGRRPFVAPTLGELRDSVLKTDPPTPMSGDLPRELVNAVSRGLSKRRHERFANMGELASLLESLTADIDLHVGWSDPTPVTEPSSRPSAYDAYLQPLPDGLETAPEALIPSRVTRLILAQKPLENPPAALIPVLRELHAKDSLSQVKTRALVCALYDEHFDSLAAFEAFMEPVAIGVMRVVFGVQSCPAPSSRHYLDVLLSVYNNATPGMVMSAIERAPWSARIRVAHPPSTVADVHRAAITAIVRAELRASGSKVAEVAIISIAEDHFDLRAHWR